MGNSNQATKKSIRHSKQATKQSMGHSELDTVVKRGKTRGKKHKEKLTSGFHLAPDWFK